MSDIICISHLRWDFVWQRPQQLLSRLSSTGRLFFVEEPVAPIGTGEPHLEVFPGRGGPDITIIRLIYPVEKADWTEMLDAVTHTTWLGHGDPRTQAIYRQLLLDYFQAEASVKEGVLATPVLWLYTPMALDFVEAINHRVLVYDVMDQLAAFKNAPPELLQQEEKLLRKADLVFTGGVSLYQAKQPFNSNVHLFPSGVEAAHFARAVDRANFPKPAELADLAQPILGYYGVIDERMDFPLLVEVAEARPDWNIVLVGPLAKIMPEDLPRLPNLHYPGGKSYEELPAYLAYFDVALVPFLINETTRYLSPTKTLEYMAAYKPIVSTPINDVVELFGEVVRIADTPAEFVSQVEAVLQAGNAGNQAMKSKEDELLERYSWDCLAGQMRELIDQYNT